MRLLRQLLDFAIQHQASDLHVSAGLPALMRVDGDLVPLPFPTLEPETLENCLYQMLPESLHQDFRQSLDCDFAIELPNTGRFRVNLFYQQGGIAGVFRTIPSRIPDLSELQTPAIITQLCHKAHGLILVSGATGCGKSTTLAAMVNYLNQHTQRHIITIEDPVEFIHTSQHCLIHQRQLHQHTLSFSGALKAALREDPDIILLGEMRDLETIRLALTAAETGHLVLATLHTTSAAKAIDRIVDVFPAEEKNLVRNMLSESLQAVIAQTLLKKIGGGRIAAYEIMIGTSAVRHLTREGKIAQLYSAMQTGRQEGMQTLDQSIHRLLEQGLISLEAAKMAAVNTDAFP